MIHSKKTTSGFENLVVEIETGGAACDWILYMTALLEGAASMNENGEYWDDNRIMLLRLAKEMLPTEKQLNLENKTKTP